MAMLLSVLSTLALSATVPSKSLWVTNGPVRATANDGKNIYVGGNFTFIGPNTGHGVGVNTGNSSIDPKAPFINGNVYAVVSDGSGGWFVGGDFTAVGEVARINLVHITATNIVNSSFRSDTDGPVRSLALSSNKEVLYVGGDFSNLSGAPRSRIGAVDTARGAVRAWNPIADNRIAALALSANGETLFVGGLFTTLDGQARPNIAALNTAAVSAGAYVTAWNPAGAVAAVSPIEALLVTKLDATTAEHVYAGGGAGVTGGVVAINATTATTVPWTVATNAKVRALAFAKDKVKLFVGGDFTTLAGTTRNRAGALKSTDGVLQAWNPNVDNVVRAIAVTSERIYLGGDFIKIGTAERLYVAALQNDDPGNLSGFLANANNNVHALALPDNSTVTLFVGGELTSVGGQNRKGLAAMEIVTGIPTAWNPDVVGGTVKAITVSADKTSLYVAGDFTGINTLTRNRIAKFIPGTREPTSWAPSIDPGAGNSVNAMSLSADGTPVKSFAINPANSQIIYAATDKLVYKTIDGGQNWAPASNGLASEKIRALSINAAAVDTVYAATENGFFKTVDAGATWRSANQGLSNTKLLSMTVHPTNVAIVYVGTDFLAGSPAEIFRSSDGGETWTALPNTPTHESVTALAIDTKTSPEIVLAGTKTAAWRSTDAGQTWIGLLNVTADIAKIAIVPGSASDQPSTYYVAFGNSVIRSPDDGETFAVTDTTLNDTVNDLVIHPTNTKTLFAATASQGIYRSTNGGDTWGQTPGTVSNPNAYAVAVDPSNSTTLYSSATSGFLYKSTDNGDTWVESHKGIPHDTLFVGGKFTTLDGQPRNNIAALDTSANAVGSYVTAWNPGSSGDVHALALHQQQQRLYVGGAFSTFGSSTRNRLAAVQTNNASITDWNPDANGTVYALALNSANTTIYAGGDFTSLGATPRNRLAAIDTTSGTPRTWDPGSDGAVHALLLFDDNLIFAAGAFNTIGGAARPYLASLRLDRATSNATGWSPNPNIAFPTGQLLSLNGTSVYVGGAFTSLSAQSRLYLAAYEFNSPVVKATPAGGPYRSAQTVTLGCLLASKAECPAGNEIFYSLDDSSAVPATLYSSALSLAVNTILRAYVIDIEGIRSPTITEDYILDYEGPLTSADPRGGHYTYTQTIELTCVENATKPAGCAQTFYTLDGTVPSFTEKLDASTNILSFEPTSTTRLYDPADPFPVVLNSTLKFLSVDKAGNVGPIGEESFEITRGATESGWFGVPMLGLALLGLFGRFLRLRRNCKILRPGQPST